MGKVHDRSREKRERSWVFMTALSYNDSTGMTTRLFNVDTRAGLHVGTVSDLHSPPGTSSGG